MTLVTHIEFTIVSLAMTAMGLAPLVLAVLFVPL